MIKIGQGIDIHPLVEHRDFILGGVAIPFNKGIEGDSDGDVLTHSVMDSILGALALGDLGTWFHSGVPGVMGARSLTLLQEVTRKMINAGFRISNLDTTVIVEKPRLRPYIDAMRSNLAETLQVSLDQVSVKATTTDKLGFIGHEQGVAAIAIALLERDK